MDEIKKWLEDPLVVKMALLGAALLLTFLVVKLLQRFISRYVSDNSSRYRLRKILVFIGYLVAVIMTMVVMDVNLTGLTVVLGVAGAGIAFALQEVIISIAGYLAINFANFYKVGDRVKLGGIKGDVIDIGVLRTTVMEIGEWVDADLYNGRMVRIANSFVFKEPVFNYSGDFPFLWDEIKIPVRTQSDHRYAREIFERILEEEVGAYAQKSEAAWRNITNQYRIEKAKVSPMVTLAFDQNWITFTLRYVVDYKLRRSTKDKLSARILDELAAAGDRVQIAGATLEITGFPRA